ncbi:MAG TPA: DUF4232 domain-containing protein [Streptosporangiaceae bacterium]|nr:DUF4232 domain-containing protein [Streptosporangiaceae bacterium]
MFPRVERSGNGITGAAAALIVLAAVAGCASSSSSSSSAPATSSSSAAAGGSTVVPPTTPPASLSPAVTGPAGSVPCATSDLNVTLGPANGAAGSTFQTIVFTNTSGATCNLYGYPGVSLVSAPPYAQIGLAAQRASTTPVTQVTLATGATASAVLRVVDALNFGAATCSPTKGAFLRIYPPNQTAPVYLADAAEVCAQPVQTLFISAVQTGSGGN